jgi:hypothetical protein
MQHMCDKERAYKVLMRKPERKRLPGRRRLRRKDNIVAYRAVGIQQPRDWRTYQGRFWATAR